MRGKELMKEVRTIFHITELSQNGVCAGFENKTIDIFIDTLLDFLVVYPEFFNNSSEYSMSDLIVPHTEPEVERIVKYKIVGEWLSYVIQKQNISQVATAIRFIDPVNGDIETDPQLNYIFREQEDKDSPFTFNFTKKISTIKQLEGKTKEDLEVDSIVLQNLQLYEEVIKRGN